jgi:protocatechuate 3,4-dioxygenase alpha subunit
VDERRDVSIPRTPSQTVGPFFAFALPWAEGPYVVAAGTRGAIEVTGRLLDGLDDPVSDGLIETWQADARGRFVTGAGPFRGFGRCPTDPEGRYRIVTLKPGAVRAEGGRLEAPHVAVSVFARGLLKRAVTRMYFSDESQANDADPVLCSIGDVAARKTLVAAQRDGGYVFDIRLQGDGETVFFDG